MPVAGWRPVKRGEDRIAPSAGGVIVECFLRRFPFGVWERRGETVAGPSGSVLPGRATSMVSEGGPVSLWVTGGDEKGWDS